MPNCPSCSAPVPAESRFCLSCGASLSKEAGQESEDTALTAAFDSASFGASKPGTRDSDSRFLPGDLVTDRYRIVGLLGRGGMGEVYRADDLKLAQPVALKFLPQELEHRPGLLDRFLNEVRTALKVTHPNVCRVYDIGEVNGQHFLSMEYVDGEDLGSLLRRIGRLPQERAVEVARQICAGLAAAHEQGILHRDLKPANVMIDGRGQARLTDFGLAGLADSIRPEDVASGTPAYMAPEQISGKEVTVRSDIYSLGLVLYELFTGKPTFKGDSPAEITAEHIGSLPSRPSVHVEGLDPAVERTVMKCLEKNPADRPQSVLAISAALPGGDPLAAAIAAGETPSPELVAEAGRREGMEPKVAVLLAIIGLIAFIGATRWASTMTITNFLPLEKRPEVLMDRAQGILQDLGYVEPAYTDPVDDAWGLILWNSVIQEVGEADSSTTRWDGLSERSDAMSFWYRQSPRLLKPDPQSTPVFVRGPVQLMNPTPDTPGEAMILLDLAGNLRRLEVMPKRFSTDVKDEPDWAPLFDMAGLDRTRFEEDRPRYQRFLAPDHRRAWIGTRAEVPDVELRVEAGSFEGRPVLFNVSSSQSLQGLSNDPAPSRPGIAETIFESLASILILIVVIGAWFVSRRNIRQGRVDRRGAARFAGIAFALFLVANGLRGHDVFTLSFFDEIWSLLIGATFPAAIAWLLYTAAEPYGRQTWPTIFISSSRLLSRPQIQWLDPVIGKSVLVGLLAGSLRFVINNPAHWWIDVWTKGVSLFPLGINLLLLQGQRQALSVILDYALLLCFVLILIGALIGIQLLVKRRIPVLILTFIVWTLMDMTSSGSGIAYQAVGTVLSLFVLLRWGIVAMFMSMLVASIAEDAKSADLSAWYGNGSALALTFIVALTIYGVWAAIGSRRTESVEDPFRTSGSTSV